MNIINYSNDFKQFPVSTRALIFAQDMIKQCFNLALLGGSTPYILSGCENTVGNTWSEGLVVVNGELMIFKGGTGTISTSVRVKTELADVTAGYETYDGVYTTRFVEFGTNVANAETYIWSDFIRIKSNLELAAQCATKTELNALANLVFPKGGILQYDILNNDPLDPEYWQLCDGTAKAGYGTVPDYRGRVVIGIDSRSNAEPANVTNTAENYKNAGNTGGKPTVTLTAVQMPVHNHVVTVNMANSGSGDWNLDTIHVEASTNGTVDYSGIQVGQMSNAGGGEAHENRMAYIVMPSYVKIK